MILLAFARASEGFKPRFSAPGNKFRFLNEGTTKKGDTYLIRSVPSIYNEGYTFYGQGRTKYSVGGLDYLYQARGEEYVAPPSGMRSAVPLGPMGEGAVELRADGRLADWGTIFNNAPYTPDPSWARKIDIDEAMFALATKSRGRKPVAKAMRTTLPERLHSLGMVDELTYNGGFPAARLRVTDADLDVDASLTAFGEFAVHQPENSTAPIVFFSFHFKNKRKWPVNASVLFSMPDVLNGTFKKWGQRGVTLNRGAKTSDSEGSDPVERNKWGNLTLSVVEASHGSSTFYPILAQNLSQAFSTFQAFSSGKGSSELANVSTEGDGGATAQTGAISVRVPLEAKGNGHVILALSWFFPHRMWGSVDLGHFYQNFYNSSEHVAEKEGTPAHVREVEESGSKWQALCLNNSFPAFLQDVLMNSASVWGKTALYLRDGRWRNFESHSCSQMEPPHIHLPRSLGYILNMPSLERQASEIYSSKILDSGVISESFGCSCPGCAGAVCNLDDPDGAPRADDNPAFLLDLYMNYKWTLDGQAFLRANWPQALRALSFVRHQPERYNLTYRMVNTNDEHGVIGDINTYNSMMFLVTMAVGAELATAMEDSPLRESCLAALSRGRDTLHTLLWNQKDGFWRQAWCEYSTEQSDALQAGALYANLWAAVLNLTETVGIPRTKIISHLQQERMRNSSPYGFYFSTNRSIDYYRDGCPRDQGRAGRTAQKFSDRKDTSFDKFTRVAESQSTLSAQFQDRDNWNIHSVTHAALALYTNATGATNALRVAQEMLDTYRVILADQWDFRDTTTMYGETLVPSVNSHYGRQTMFWSIALALTGQQLDVPSRRLSFDPHPEFASRQWPLLTPFCSGLLKLVTLMSAGKQEGASACLAFSLLAGDLAILKMFNVSVSSKEYSFEETSEFMEADALLCPERKDEAQQISSI